MIGDGRSRRDSCPVTATGPHPGPLLSRRGMRDDLAVPSRWWTPGLRMRLEVEPLMPALLHPSRSSPRSPGSGHPQSSRGSPTAPDRCGVRPWSIASRPNAGPERAPQAKPATRDPKQRPCTFQKSTMATSTSRRQPRRPLTPSRRTPTLTAHHRLPCKAKHVMGDLRTSRYRGRQPPRSLRRLASGFVLNHESARSLMARPVWVVDHVAMEVKPT